MTSTPAGIEEFNNVVRYEALMEVVRTRMTNREFVADYEVPKQHFEMILEAARHAPSGANAQPWHYIPCERSYAPRSPDHVFSRRAATPRAAENGLSNAELQRRENCARPDCGVLRLQIYPRVPCFDGWIGRRQAVPTECRAHFAAVSGGIDDVSASCGGGARLRGLVDHRHRPGSHSRENRASSGRPEGAFDHRRDVLRATAEAVV